MPGFSFPVAHLRRLNLRLFAACLLIFPATLSAYPQARSPLRAHVPPELKVTDASVERFLDAADQAANLGKYGECLTSLQRALEFTTKKRLLGDKAIVEGRLAVYYFAHGKLEDAKSQWLNSLSDGMARRSLISRSTFSISDCAIAFLGSKWNLDSTDCRQANNFVAYFGPMPGTCVIAP